MGTLQHARGGRPGRKVAEDNLVVLPDLGGSADRAAGERHRRDKSNEHTVTLAGRSVTLALTRPLALVLSPPVCAIGWHPLPRATDSDA